MCGRYGVTIDWKQFAAIFGHTPDSLPDHIKDARMNVRPTQQVLFVDESFDSGVMQWGVELPKRLLINARDDSIPTSRLWRPMAETSRILIPASGWYEWTGPKGQRQPHWFTTDDELIAFAGITRGTGDDRQGVIITTEPSEIAGRYHNRMPAIIKREDFDTWLSGDLEDALSMLGPYEGSIEIEDMAVGSV
ncbi:MAG: SOS response-associated peptidase [Solirubrobacterales bacterium]